VSLLGVKNPIAEESIQADATPRRSSNAASDVESAFAPDQGASLSAVPDINYKSEIKVEDLPF
jgi:hypothetical protein